MTEAVVVENAAVSLPFFPVEISSLSDGPLMMDLYRRPDGETALELFRGVGSDFGPDERSELVQNEVRFLYVPMHHHRAYRRTLSSNLDQAFTDPNLHRAERSRMIRSMCTRMIEDLLLFPRQQEPVQLIAEVSKTFASWSQNNETEFSYLLDMSAHDFYTVTHMINVGVGCGLLIRELEANDLELHSVIIQGGLLHDIGKRGVPEEILNKEGRLESDEWALIQQHPLTGYEELRVHGNVPGTICEMVRDHHERLDGTGYPNKLAADQISFAARLCAVVDVYDAIASARPYRGPTPPADVLRIMREGAGAQFDERILEAWAVIVERLLEADPARAVPRSEEPVILKLDEVTPMAPSARGTPEEGSCGACGGSERRRFVRVACNIRVRARFVRATDRSPVPVGEWFYLTARDISRGGLRLVTPWPLVLSDELQVELPQKQRGAQMALLARVVCVQRMTDRNWSAGVKFTNRVANA